MPAQNETLPDFLIADLYKSSLVELDEERLLTKPAATVDFTNQPDVSIAEDDTLKYLGGNKQKVVVVLIEPDSIFIDDKDLSFLSNILAACKLTLDDISIINIAKQPIAFTEVKEKMTARYFLLFGVEPTDIKMPFAIPQFQVQQYAACTIVTAPALNQLNVESEAGKLLRTKLWLSLQRCFDIKAAAKN